MIASLWHRRKCCQELFIVKIWNTSATHCSIPEALIFTIFKVQAQKEKTVFAPNCVDDDNDIRGCSIISGSYLDPFLTPPLPPVIKCDHLAYSPPHILILRYLNEIEGWYSIYILQSLNVKHCNSNRMILNSLNSWMLNSNLLV